MCVADAAGLAQRRFTFVTSVFVGATAPSVSGAKRVSREESVQYAIQSCARPVIARICHCVNADIPRPSMPRASVSIHVSNVRGRVLCVMLSSAMRALRGRCVLIASERKIQPISNQGSPRCATATTTPVAATPTILATAFLLLPLTARLPVIPTTGSSGRSAGPERHKGSLKSAANVRRKAEGKEPSTKRHRRGDGLHKADRNHQQGAQLRPFI